jgi:hypothetical protein
LFGDWTKLGRSLGNLIHLTTGLRCHGFDLDSLTDVVTVRDPFLFSLNSQIETAGYADFTDFGGVIGDEPTNGYGAFSVSESNVESVTAYIDNQAEHHVWD